MASARRVVRQVPAGPVDVPALIRARLPELSPNDRRIASWLLEHYAEASFDTAESLAGRVGVSKAAVVRFGTRLG
ncbi:MAG TPA: MurR/RpiR family transcriptional regulator, partial [Methylomirabilota bacterium]|nr:MurR/RpiR family transcriptional regulator [Methylomirabilota bacterium]